jgi:hypothetical protein
VPQLTDNYFKHGLASATGRSYGGLIVALRLQATGHSQSGSRRVFDQITLVAGPAGRYFGIQSILKRSVAEFLYIFLIQLCQNNLMGCSMDQPTSISLSERGRWGLSQCQYPLPDQSSLPNVPLA